MDFFFYFFAILLKAAFYLELKPERTSKELEKELLFPKFISDYYYKL